ALGQLGSTDVVGPGASRWQPTQVMSNVVAIAAGGHHSLAITADGALWTFGDNAYGQLGTADGISPDLPHPTPVPVLSNVSSIAAGDSHSLAVKSDGSLWTFGYNTAGQLGSTVNNLTSNPNPTPTKVADGVLEAGSGGFQSFIATADRR